MSRVLIDTHALIWLAERPDRLSLAAVRLFDDPATIRFASTASVWEMAIKLSIGKLKLASGSLRQFVTTLDANDIALLPITADDALAVETLPQGVHKDPFDRLIAAQCLRLDLTLISADPSFDAYGVRRLG